MIKLIWAQTQQGVIGDKQTLPWKIPQEMQHFQKTTLNQTVVMGANTFDSMHQKPLKNRQNYVLTQDVKKYQNIHFPNLHFIHKIDELIQQFQGSATPSLYVIGGNQVFQSFFGVADEIIRTIIYQDYRGDLKIQDFDFSQFKLKRTQKEDKFEVQYFERI